MAGMLNFERGKPGMFGWKPRSYLKESLHTYIHARHHSLLNNSFL